MHPSGGLAASSPYREAFPAAASNASPVRGGGCAAGADGGVPHLTLQVSFRTAAHPRLLHPSGSWRLCETAGFAPSKPRGTMQAASRGNAGQDSAGFWKIPLIQSSNAPSGGLAASSPYREAFPAAASNASPVRGGGCAAGADGGVPHLALQVSFRAVTHPRPPARIISIPLPCLPRRSSTKNARRKTRRALFPWSGSQITERRPCWRAWPYG